MSIKLRSVDGQGLREAPTHIPSTVYTPTNMAVISIICTAYPRGSVAIAVRSVNITTQMS